MVAIARATSPTVVRRRVVNRCGSTVWSMMPTDQPSASTQMVRVCLPSTFMAPDIAAIHRKASRGRLFLSLSPQAERGDRQARGRAHADRLQGRIQQPRPRTRASRNLRPLGARGRGLPGRGDEGTARRARPELRITTAPVHRPVLASPRRGGAARAVYPRRLLALARPIAVQPYGARAQFPRRGGRGRGLRSLPGGHHRRDHRSDPARMPVPVAAHRSAHDDLRPLRRRTSRRRHGGDRLAGAYPKAPPDLVPAAYSISGLFDLTPLVGLAMAQDLRLDETEARRVSPLFWPAPKDRAFDAVVGGLESSEFLRQSRIVADSWGKAGAQTRYEAVAGTNHFTVIDALADRQSAMVGRLTELATPRA